MGADSLHRWGRKANRQEASFHAKALKPFVWTKVDRNHFPKEGIFGHDWDWFSQHEIEYVATFDNEDLVLIRRLWFGFPNPPQWALASRPAGNEQASREMWGSFPDLPKAWTAPDTV